MCWWKLSEILQVESDIFMLIQQFLRFLIVYLLKFLSKYIIPYHFFGQNFMFFLLVASILASDALQKIIFLTYKRFDYIFYLFLLILPNFSNIILASSQKYVSSYLMNKFWKFHSSLKWCRKINLIHPTITFICI